MDGRVDAMRIAVLRSNLQRLAVKLKKGIKYCSVTLGIPYFAIIQFSIVRAPVPELILVVFLNSKARIVRLWPFGRFKSFAYVLALIIIAISPPKPAVRCNPTSRIGEVLTQNASFRLDSTPLLPLFVPGHAPFPQPHGPQLPNLPIDSFRNWPTWTRTIPRE